MSRGYENGLGHGLPERVLGSNYTGVEGLAAVMIKQ